MYKWFATLVLTSAMLAHPLSLVTNGQELNLERKYQALYLKPAVVRICNGIIGVLEWRGKQQQINKLSCGSGFFINPDGFIVTNAHVTEFAYKQEGASEDEIKQRVFSALVEKIAQDSGSTAHSVTQEAKLSNFRYIHHVILPVCGEPLPFVVKKFGKPNGEGEDAAIIKIEIENAPILKLGNSKQVQLQDPVMLVGYPGAADSIPNCKSFHEASFSRGIVSAKKEDESGNQIIQLDAIASPGNSGGPVLNDEGEVIGLATAIGVSGSQPVYGITFVVPTSKIQQYIQDAGTSNQEGATNRLYRDGLELYAKRCYAVSINKFESVKQIFPQHSEADKLIRDSRQAISENRERLEFFCWLDGMKSPQLLIRLLLAAGVIVVLIALFFFIRRKSVDFL